MDYTELSPHQEVHQTGIIYDLKSLLHNPEHVDQ